MADIATMRFQSNNNPVEKGALILATDGTLRMEPSDEMLEKIASLEQKAVEVSGRSSKIVAATFISLGVIAAVIGWFAGRMGGRLRDRLITPRSVATANLNYIAEQGVQVVFRNPMSPPVMLTWERGEYNVDEVEDFVRAYNAVKKSQPELG